MATLESSIAPQDQFNDEPVMNQRYRCMEDTVVWRSRLIVGCEAL